MFWGRFRWKKFWSNIFQKLIKQFSTHIKRRPNTIRKTKKGFKKWLVKGIKIFLKKKKQKRKYACKRYQNLSEERQDKKQQYRCKHRKMFSGDERRWIAEHRRNYHIPHKKWNFNFLTIIEQLKKYTEFPYCLL